jgi:uncharacterized protein (DUF4415 family)
MSHNLEPDETETEDMLEEYDFSNARPGRYREFQGRLIRVLENGIEQPIELKSPITASTVQPGQRCLNLYLDAFIVDYFESEAGGQELQDLINQVLAEYVHGHRQQG